MAYYYISIPYGAIKSNNFDLIVEPNQKFQFLMVRLKVESYVKDELEIKKFQFLMVRLKVI